MYFSRREFSQFILPPNQQELVSLLILFLHHEVFNNQTNTYKQTSNDLITLKSLMKYSKILKMHLIIFGQTLKEFQKIQLCTALEKDIPLTRKHFHLTYIDILFIFSFIS